MLTMLKHRRTVHRLLSDDDFLTTLLAMPLIGDRIRSARLRAGYQSQGAFAGALGVSRGLVGQWEAHHKPPGRDNLLKIAKLCGISMEYLLGASTEMQRSVIATADHEVDMLLQYRRLPPEGQENLRKILNMILDGARVTQKKSQPA